MQAGIEQSQHYVQRAADEMKLYVSSAASGQNPVPGKSVRDQLQQKINEQDKLNAQLRLDHGRMKESIPQLDQQLVYWERIEKYFCIILVNGFLLNCAFNHAYLKRIFRAKQLCQEREKRNEGTVKRERGRETLVLQ